MVILGCHKKSHFFLNSRILELIENITVHHKLEVKILFVKVIAELNRID